MTDRLKEAMEQAAGLPPEDQDEIAERMLRLIAADSEAAWDATFARNADKLDKLAKAARDDYHAGRTTPLDPDKL